MVKILQKITVTGLAVLMISQMVGLQLAFGLISTDSNPTSLIADDPAPAATPATPAVEKKGSSIDETFDTKKWLTTGGQGKKFTGKGFQYVLAEVIGTFVKIIASVSLLVFIFGALLTILSEGKEDRLEKGKTAMLYSILGLVIAMFSFLIVAFIQSFFY